MEIINRLLSDVLCCLPDIYSILLPVSLIGVYLRFSIVRRFLEYSVRFDYDFRYKYIKEIFISHH